MYRRPYVFLFVAIQVLALSLVAVCLVVSLKNFASAGADGKLVPAKAVIDGADVLVSSAEVPNPVAVRYAYCQDSAGCNLYNKEGLPGSPFRTDNW